MSDNVCPICGLVIKCPHGRGDFINKINRLKAELEMAEFEAKRYSDILDSTRLVRDMLETERDEARRLAREYYQLWHVAEDELLRLKNGGTHERE